MNLSDIILLLHPKADRLKDIILQDDGDGPYIIYWNDALFGPRPTEESLLLQKADLQAAYDNKAVIAKRIEEYGSIGEQLDMMYWDQVNGTTVFQDHIAAVKTANPKV